MAADGIGWGLVPRHDHGGQTVRRVFDDEGMEFDRLLLLGWAYRRLSDAGEVLEALDGVTDGDGETWISQLSALADRVRARAEASEAAGHGESARSAYLRASTYYASASSYAPGTDRPERFTALWEQHRDCWDHAVPYFRPSVEKVALPYEDTALEGYFFHADGAEAPGGRRPTLVFNNGSDGPVTDAWAGGCAAAVERGWNAFTFDGPGQNTALHRQGLFFRHDWEAVITPVVDWLVERDDVDADRLALVGVSQAGYWVPRAVAFEHRIAAAVADPGVVRVSDSWRDPLPEVMIDLLDQGNKADFDAFMEIGMAEDPATRALLAWRMAPYGLSSYYDAYAAADEMHLDEATLARIRCPLLILSPDHEQFWPGQSEELHAAVEGSTLVAFTEAEGADWHCEPAARGQRDEVVCDWLAGIFA